MEVVTASMSTRSVDQGFAKSGDQTDIEDSDGEESAVQLSTAQESEPVKSDTNPLIGTHLDISV